MKHLVLPLVLALVLSPRSESEPPEPADIVFVNGKVHTVNDAQPQAEAIAIKGERIVFVGSNAEANKYSGPITRTIDLKGKTVVPGFTDSHYHIFGVGHQAAQPSFDETTSRGAVLARVKEEAEEGGPESGSPAAAGSKPSGNPPAFSIAKSWTRSLRPTRFSSNESMATARSRTVRRCNSPGSIRKRLILSEEKFSTTRKPASPPACCSTTRWI